MTSWDRLHVACTPFTDDGLDPETFAILLKVKALVTSRLEVES